MTNGPAASVADPIRAYLEARNYIDVELIRLTPRPRDVEAKVRTALAFYEALGNPQAAYPSVQVAGTSGKGSVAMALAQILQAAGQHTGLHVSPYLQVATEKSWVAGRYLSGVAFQAACEAVRPVAEHYRRQEDCPTSVHGMASLALSFEAFRRQAIDWCVMETGVGGRFDLVQGLHRSLAVITDIGLDHVKTLGETRRDIAWHKAGIMAGCEEAVAVYDPVIWPVFEAEAAARGTRLVPVVPDAVGTICRGSAGPELVLDLATLGRVEVPFCAREGGFQQRNATVAAVAADHLARQGVPITRDALRTGLCARGLPGRLEQVQEGPEVILDGAHNGQKMAGLLRSLPRGTGRRHLVLGATGERHFDEVVGAFPEAPASLTLTRPLLYGKSVADPLEMLPRARHLACVVQAAASPQAALQMALAQARPEDQVLVTGSLYLVGQLRNRYFPWQEVLRQGTSWPIVRSQDSSLS